MPKRSYRKCNDISCSELTHDSYCDKHSKDVHKDYKRNRQDKKEQAFYSSSSWIKLRNHKRMLNPLCEICLLEDRLTPVDIVHHMCEIKEDWELRLTLSNLQSVCFSHHQKIHKNESK